MFSVADDLHLLVYAWLLDRLTPDAGEPSRTLNLDELRGYLSNAPERSGPLGSQQPTSDVDDPSSALDRARGVGLRDVVGLVRGSSLHREETGELLGDGGPVGAGGAEEHKRLVVITASSPLPQAHAGHRIAALIPAWIARLVAAIARPASSPELAAERYSSALLT